MADLKITQFTADTSPSSDDLVLTVNDPSGSPSNKKVTLGDAVTKAHGLSNGVIKVSTGVMSIATSGTDYAPATSGTSILKGSGSGGFSNATAGTDYQVPITAGDVTTSGATSTIGSNKVTNSMLSTVATSTFKGRTTAGTGNVEDLTSTQATALLNNFVGDSGAGGTKGLVPAPSTGDATKFLKGDGTWATPSGGSGLSDGDYGDITVSGSGTVMNIDASTIGLTELSATGTPSSSTFLRGDNTWATPSGSGTVTNTGGNLTSNSVVLGAGTTDTKVVAGVTTDGTSQLNLGVNATTIGKVKLFGNTSGDTTIQPSAVAGTGTVITLPATTGTVVTTGDTGTVTNTMLSGSIANAKLANSSITIAGTSTALGGSITQDTITGLSTTGIIKRTASNTLAIATSSTDYAPATSGSAILKGNGSGGFSSASSGTDYVAPGAVTTSGITMSTNKMLGRSTAATGAIEEISVTGTGNAVLATSPTLTTPTIGVATATSINKMAITAPATSSTLAVADGKTFTVSNTITLTGTDSVSMNVSNSKASQITMIIGDGVNAISANATSFPIPCTFAGTITGYSISVDAGTCTMKTWKKATGTAIPTSGDSISTSGVSISSGTHVRSTTVSDFTSTTVTANDIFIATCTSVATAKYIVFTLEITKS